MKKKKKGEGRNVGRKEGRKGGRSKEKKGGGEEGRNLNRKK